MIFSPHAYTKQHARKPPFLLLFMFSQPRTKTRPSHRFRDSKIEFLIIFVISYSLEAMAPARMRPRSAARKPGHRSTKAQAMRAPGQHQAFRTTFLFSNRRVAPLPQAGNASPAFSISACLIDCSQLSMRFLSVFT